MAKKKKTSRRRRRSSVGAVGTTDLMQIAVMAGGAIAGRIAATKFLSSMNPKLAAGVQIAAGVMLPKVMKGNAFAKSFGAGMATNGTVDLVKSTGMISGMDETVSVDYVGEISNTLAGPGIQNDIAGIDDDDSMSGMDDDAMIREYERMSGMGFGEDDDNE